MNWLTRLLTRREPEKPKQQDDDICRRGPRFILWLEFDLKGIRPKITCRNGHLFVSAGWLSLNVLVGKAKDFVLDALICGVDKPQEPGKRICSRCHQPIRHKDNYAFGADGRIAHKDCAHPRLRDPQLDLLPDALSRLPEVSE